ncbi:HD domain-containing protein [Ferrimonas sp. YFM]|uniref:HD domain-containing protein n=1 Tax=Ferrimonas sp. YFM TaxID=3028878 RepID=UPI00257341A7|nr:HD domain-containing protein [Ferrimonas sp. YFM]BDY06916.1 phosphohydrolase [Ferrimonas sp. YFM]
MTPRHFTESLKQLGLDWLTTHQSDAAHDLDHILRVYTTAGRLGQQEGANPDILLPAALLHDCVSIDKRDPRRSQASTLSADAAVAWLAQHDYPAELLGAIHHAIASHSWSAGLETNTLEARVLQDADRLDALGAIGTARCLMLGGQWQSTLYHGDDPFADSREYDDKTYCLDHFYVKLQHLAGQLKTDAGRQEGERRWRWMEGFIQQLQSELPE